MGSAASAVHIQAIETAVPTTSVPQEEVRDLLLARLGGSRLTERLVGTVFDASEVDSRHLVMAELPGALTTRSEYLVPREASPSTAARNAVVGEHSRRLAADAASKALAGAATPASAVTHVITVCCTGFSAPGLDFGLVRDLGLPASTARTHIGFMGCCGAFPALRAARAICASDPDATALVVCVEVCSVHLHLADAPEAIIAASVFADGAAAIVVSGREPRAGAAALRLDAFETVLADGGEQDLTWTIGDHGFEMVLTPSVPRLIESQIPAAIDALRRDLGTKRAWREVEHWAVHPGGAAILRRVERALELAEPQLAPSRAVLREYGNMSSATVPFILRRILASPDARDGERLCALAFGPGLTVESGLLTVRRAA